MRGQSGQTKVHFKGKDEDFIVFVDSQEALEQWKKDKSTPLAQVASSFKVFITHKHGSQGVLDGASKGTLEDEFGTSRDDDVVKAILESGTVVETEFPGRDGGHNAARGDRAF